MLLASLLAFAPALEPLGGAALAPAGATVAAPGESEGQDDASPDSTRGAQQNAPRATVRVARLSQDRSTYSAEARDALLYGGPLPSELDSGGGGGGIPTVPGGVLSLLTMNVPATGLEESFLFFEPHQPLAPTAPLLVHFHAAGVSGFDLLFFTDFLAEAAARSWFVVAPFQLVADPPTQNSYSSLPSQAHVEAVMAWVLANAPVDLDRIYGYGFSMGAGNAMNFAARHLDRSLGAFAALVNHTGTLSLTDEYAHGVSPLDVRPVLENLFGGPPSTHRYEYLRSSILDIDAERRLLLGGDHAAVNLAHVPIQSWFATNDPHMHLVAQARELHLLFKLLNGARHEVREVPGNEHTWATLDETAICDWFATHSLGRPSGGELRVDRSARFLALDVEVRSSARFAHLFYDYRPERLSVTRADNVQRVRVDAGDVALDPARNPFTVLVEVAEAAPLAVEIAGFFRTPGAVLRDGEPAAGGWSYDAGAGILTVVCEGPEQQLWSIE